MEKVAAVERPGGKGSFGRCAAVAWLACMAPAFAATGEPVPADVVMVAEARLDAPVRVQVDASNVPRLEAQESGFQSPRVDVSLFPSTTPRVGAMVGMSGFQSQPQGAAGLQAAKPSVDVGVRYSHHQVDVTAWRRMNVEADLASAPNRQAVYGARVEMNLATAKTSGFALDRGFVGFQLESGARISVKRKDGRPMVYYRTSF